MVQHLIGIGGGGCPVCDECMEAMLNAGDADFSEFVPTDEADLDCGFHLETVGAA